MGKTKKELMSKAPWRGDDGEDENLFKDAKLSATNQPGSTPVMHVPGKNKKKPVDDDEDDLEIDPELRYSFQRNFQVVVWTLDKDIIAAMNDIHVESKFLQRVFSIDTIVKPLPPAMAYNASRNLSFFTRIFTQFFDPEGIANAQKTLGIGQEERERRVRD